ncbi:MAG: hypothetical protein V4671_17215 [Armatimonadota bacterium]
MALSENACPIEVPSAALPSSRKRSRAITTATDSLTSPLACQATQAESAQTKDPIRESVLITLEQDLLSLLNQTAFILVRVKRPLSASSGPGTAAGRRPAAKAVEATPESDTVSADNQAWGPFGAVVTGRETAQNIEGRARGLLLETSLKHIQQVRIERILQSTQDLLCALQASRYAWQIALLLTEEGSTGRTALPRLKRVSECVIEMSSRVTFAVEGREGAAGVVAEQYRAFQAVNDETSRCFAAQHENGALSCSAWRLSRSALWSMTVAAESMAKVAARFALPIETIRDISQDQEKYKQVDRGDDLLSPLRRR